MEQNKQRWKNTRGLLPPADRKQLEDIDNIFHVPMKRYPWAQGRANMLAK